MKIIGVAGSFASGKDTIADYLVKEQGFYHVSTSDLVRKAAMAKYGSIERPILYKTANEIRHANGHGALSQMALDEYETVKESYPAGVVITGLRALAEAEVIKQAGGKIIFTDAPFEVRFERMQARARDGEAKVSREEFEERERNENGGIDPAFDISKIKTIAEKIITNDGSYEEFLDKIVEIVE